ncbi:MAG: hypothetical protein Q8J97_04370, partial [Flavobacteriaceae bacterium]|nr:hypothetical protein [Flavobacteriaceae bacterium]
MRDVWYLESIRETEEECCTKDGSPLDDKTKVEAERTELEIIIINKGSGHPQTTFRSSLQTTVRLRLQRERSTELTPKSQSNVHAKVLPLVNIS